MLKGRIRAVPFIALCILAGLVIGLFTVFVALQYQPVQRFALRQWLKYYNIKHLQISFSKTRVSLGKRLTLKVDNIAIRYDDSTPVASISHVTAMFRLMSVLHGRFTPEIVEIVRPKLRWNKSKSRLGNVEEIVALVGSFLGYASKVGRFRIQDGTIWWGDYVFKLFKTDLSVYRSEKGLYSRILADGNLRLGKEACPIKVNGKLVNQADGKLSRADFQLRALSLPMSWFSGYYNLQFKSGEASIVADFKYQNNTFQIECSINANRPKFLLRSSSREKRYSFPWLSLKFSSNCRNGTIEVPGFCVDGPQMSLSGTFSASLEDSPKTIKLKVKTPFLPFESFRKIFPDPLVGHWITQRLFPSLSGGLVKVEEFSIAGALDRIRKLGLPENRSCFSLHIAWTDLSAFEGRKPFAFRHSSGTLSISNGELRISGVKGSFGNSKVLNGSMELSDLYSNIEPYVNVIGTLDLADLSHIWNMPLVYKRVPRFLKDFKEIRGTSRVQFSGRFKRTSGFEPEYAKLESKKCRVTFRDTAVTITAANFIYRRGFAFRFRGRVSVSHCNFTVAGQGSDDFSYLSLWAKGEGNVPLITRRVLALGPLHLEGAGQGFWSLSMSKYRSRIETEALVSFTRIRITARGFETKLGRPGDMLFFRVNKEGERDFQLDDIIWFQETGAVQGSLKWDEKEGTAKITLLGQNASFDRLQVFQNGNLYEISGTLDCELRGEIRRWKLRKLKLFGKAEAYGVTVYRQGRVTPFSSCQIGLTFEGRRFNLDCMRTNISGLPVFATGSFRGWDRLEGKMHIELESLDLRPLIIGKVREWGDRPPTFMKLFPPHSNIRMTFNVARATLGSMELGKLKASGVVKKDGIHMEKCFLLSPHLKISSVGYLKDKDMGGYYLSSYLKVTDLPMEELILGLGVDHSFIEGNLNMEAFLTSQGRDLRDFVTGLSGMGNFEIEKGKILKSTILIKVLKFLSIQKIFTKEPPNLSKKGFYFSQIKGSAEIKNGIVKSDEVVMSSPVFNAVARGKIDLNDKKIKVEFGAQPFVTLDSVLSKVPLVGYILTGKERSLLVYYFNIKGNLGNPDVQYVPFKNMGKSALLFLRRAFLTPVRVFKNIGKTLEKLSKMGKPVPLRSLDAPIH